GFPRVHRNEPAIIPAVRIVVRILAIALALALAFIFLGPLAPEGTFIEEWSISLREVMNAWWGFPFGLPT
ncbi:MAG: hypothetical protein OEM66_04950, partial [Acidimicrobiia bacterium]|nr:hypothetical protein [Acidimicrobiia bacterium]